MQSMEVLYIFCLSPAPPIERERPKSRSDEYCISGDLCSDTERDSETGHGFALSLSLSSTSPKSLFVVVARSELAPPLSFS